jgi:aldehyde dehydrogenase (NAD+)
VGPIDVRGALLEGETVSTRTSAGEQPGSGEEGARAVVDRLRAAFRSGVTRPVSWRREQLAQLRRLLVEGEDELMEAVGVDLAKPSGEAYMAEIGLTVAEIRHIEKHLDAWMAPRRVKVPLKMRPASARIISEPLGVALVLAPWNLPVQLLLMPLATALGAGNAVVLKPSEIAPHVSAAMARLIPKYLDERAVAVVEGGVEETTALLDQRFDHIFYTGSTEVGRIVMTAAARHLTPVTLELGGKSPAIVASDAKLDVAARRIAFGRFANGGQACIAADYVLVDRDVEQALVERLVAAVRRFFGNDPKASPDYMPVVNERHWRRLKGLLDAGGYESVACGGDGDQSSLYLAPTILTGVDRDAAVMRSEIFGPILPVLAIDDLDAAIEHVNAGEKPLALYIFSEDDALVGHVLAATSSGGVCVNGTIFQVTIPDLPFGGVGESGMGAYHGRYGFDTFSHRRSVLCRSTRIDPAAMYPPMTALKERLMRRFA